MNEMIADVLTKPKGPKSFNNMIANIMDGVSHARAAMSKRKEMMLKKFNANRMNLLVHKDSGRRLLNGIYVVETILKEIVHTRMKQ